MRPYPDKRLINFSFLYQMLVKPIPVLYVLHNIKRAQGAREAGFDGSAGERQGQRQAAGQPAHGRARGSVVGARDRAGHGCAGRRRVGGRTAVLATAARTRSGEAVGTNRRCTFIADAADAIVGSNAVPITSDRHGRWTLDRSARCRRDGRRCAPVRAPFSLTRPDTNNRHPDGARALHGQRCRRTRSGDRQEHGLVGRAPCRAVSARTRSQSP